MNGSQVPDWSDWCPVRITAAGTDANGKAIYTFVECWQVAQGLIADRIGGRVNSANDPAYAIDGSTFAVTVAGSPVQVLARRAIGAGNGAWELIPVFSPPTPPIARAGGAILQSGAILGGLSYSSYLCFVDLAVLIFSQPGESISFPLDKTVNLIVFHATGMIVAGTPGDIVTVGLASWGATAGPTPPAATTVYGNLTVQIRSDGQAPFSILAVATKPPIDGSQYYIAPAMSGTGVISTVAFAGSW